MAQILLIEDMKGVRDSLSMVLEKAGHTVTLATDGAEGMSAAQSAAFDLVITDILMPTRDGSEVVISLKKEDANRPVLAMSGGSAMIPAEDALALAGKFADEVMQKPFSRNDILAAVDRLTGSSD